MNSLRGHLLVASPSLRDPNFLRTVVLLIEHSDEGAMGLVLNRPSRLSLKEAWAQIRDTPCQIDDSLFQGGPCPAPLMAIHSQRKWLEAEVTSRIFFSAGQERLDALVARAKKPIRFFIGCAGWGPGQLEAELEEGAWHTLPASVDHIFGPVGEDLWEMVRRHLADASLFSLLAIKHVPDDASLN